MICFWLFLLFAAAVAAAVLLAGGAAWLAALCFAGAFALAHVLFLLLARLLTPRCDLSAPDARINAFDRWGSVQVGQLLCLYCGARPVIRGAEKLPESGRFLFVCNHRSMLDPLIVMGRVGKGSIAFISKPSNLAAPIVGHCARAAGYLAIDRENDRAALKTILTAVDYLKRDLCSVGIYPEGTRSRSGELLPFRSGSFKIAQRAKVPVAVACVRDTEKAVKGLFLRPRRCSLDILEVLPAERVCAMNTHELADCCRALMEKHLKEAGKA